MTDRQTFHIPRAEAAGAAVATRQTISMPEALAAQPRSCLVQLLDRLEERLAVALVLPECRGPRSAAAGLAAAETTLAQEATVATERFLEAAAVVAAGQ